MKTKLLCSAIAILILSSLAWAVIQETNCLTHSVTAKWTGKKKTEAYRPDQCEYSHKYTENGQEKTHAFWKGCDEL
jgi:hypothetical protein